MRKKKIVVFFGKKRKRSDPFWDFGEKREVYYYFFAKGVEMGLEMFIANGRETYKENLDFLNVLRYEDGKFVAKKGLTRADAVYDRSGGLEFPTQMISDKVLNNAEFKRLCYDKYLTYVLLKKYMAKSYKIGDKKTLLDRLQSLEKNRKYVIKPVDGLGGKGIVIDFPEVLRNYILKKNKCYVLQEVIETSGGIKGIVDGRHDLRVVIAEGEIIWSHVRMPKKGSLLANVAQGGKIKEIAVKDIPDKVLTLTREIQNIIDKKYNYPVYSIDYGIENGEPFVFELNDQIGFPSVKMKNAKKFVENILKSMIRLAKNINK